MAEERPNRRVRGFAAMDPEKQREIARKGGEAVSRNRQHMAEIGRKGGEASHGQRGKRGKKEQQEGQNEGQNEQKPEENTPKEQQQSQRAQGLESLKREGERAEIEGRIGEDQPRYEEEDQEPLATGTGKV